MDCQEYVIALDGGTEAMRASIVDTAGQIVSFARVEYPTEHRRPAWAEQDPNDWWAATIVAVRKAMVDANLAPEAIRCICGAGTSCTVVLTDASGSPVRPAIIWMDVRASQEAARISASTDPVTAVLGGGPASAEWFLSKALWLATHEPDNFAAATHAVEYTDWLAWRLTGVWCANINTAAIRCFYDRARGGWPAALMSEIGLESLIDKLTPTVAELGVVLDGLSQTAAEELGLLPGTPVAVGGADAFVGQIGLNALRPGELALITGSSHLHLALTDAPTYSEGMWGGYPDAVLPGTWSIEGGQTSTGSIVKWFRRIADGHHFVDHALSSAAVYGALQAKAELLPPGSEGVLALDFWQGNRTPYVDADARGMIWGLTLAHGPEHIYRAIMEAVCFGTENILRTFAVGGHPIRSAVACGGTVNSSLWLQLHADISGIPITVTAQPEAVSLGAGILAAVGAGFFPNIRAAAGAMVRSIRSVQPDPGAHEAYQFYFQRYLDSYQQMRDSMHKVATYVRQ